MHLVCFVSSLCIRSSRDGEGFGKPCTPPHKGVKTFVFVFSSPSLYVRPSCEEGRFQETMHLSSSWNSVGIREYMFFLSLCVHASYEEGTIHVQVLDGCSEAPLLLKAFGLLCNLVFTSRFYIFASPCVLVFHCAPTHLTSSQRKPSAPQKGQRALAWQVVFINKQALGLRRPFLLPNPRPQWSCPSNTHTWNFATTLFHMSMSPISL